MEKAIGQVAKELSVSTTQLRYWVDKGLILCNRKNNARYFEESEYEKIKKVRDFFAEAEKLGTVRTIEGCRDFLFGQQLVKTAKEVEEKDRIETYVSIAFEKMLQERLTPAFAVITNALKEVAAENKMLRSRVEALPQTEIISDLNLILTAYETSLTDKIKQFAQEQQQIVIERLHIELETSKQEIESLRNEKESLLKSSNEAIKDKIKIAELQKEIERSQLENKALSDEKQILESDNEHLRNTFEQLKLQFAEFQKDYAVLERVNDELQKQNDKLRETLSKRRFLGIPF